MKSIKFAALPLPHVTVNGITVGKADDIKGGKVRAVAQIPNVL